MKSPRLWRWALALYVVVLGVISGLAYTRRLHVTLLVGNTHADKLVHFVLLGGASFLARRATSNARMRFQRLPLGPFVVGVLATMDEFAQAFSPARTFSLGDLAANLLGVIVFGWLAGAWRRGPFETNPSSSNDSS